MCTKMSADASDDGAARVRRRPLLSARPAPLWLVLMILVTIPKETQAQPAVSSQTALENQLALGPQTIHVTAFITLTDTTALVGKGCTLQRTNPNGDSGAAATRILAGPNSLNRLSFSNMTFTAGQGNNNYASALDLVADTVNSGATVETTSCSFVNNANGKYGSMYIHQKVHATITQCIFDQTSRVSSSNVPVGGLMIWGHSSDDNPTVVGVRSSTFQNNAMATHGKGAGITANRISYLTVDSCVFTTNTATLGAAIWVGPHASSDNDAIRLAKATISSSTFKSNVASTGSGGAMSVTGDKATKVWISAATFKSNTAQSNGGAMECRDFVKASITTTLFQVRQAVQLSTHN